MGVLKNPPSGPHRKLACQHLPHKRPLTGHFRLCCFTLIFYPPHSEPREAKRAERGEEREEQGTPSSLLLILGQA